MSECERLNDILAQFKAETNHRRKAQLGEQLWAEFKSLGLSVGTTHSRGRRGLWKMHGLTWSMTEVYSVLLRLGPRAAPLWDDLQSGAAVVDVLTKARLMRCDPGLDVARDRDPPEATAQVFDGIDYRPRAFWPALRQMLSEYVRLNCEGESEDVDRVLQERFAPQLRCLCDEARIAIQNCKERDRKTIRVFRLPKSEFDFACQRLAIRGVYGKKADLRVAHKQYLKLAARFHPDRNNDPAALAQYHDVNRAWDIMQKYQEMIDEKLRTGDDAAEPVQGVCGER